MRSSSTKTSSSRNAAGRALIVLLLSACCAGLAPAVEAGPKDEDRAAAAPVVVDRPAQIKLWSDRLEEAKQAGDLAAQARIARKLAGLHAVVGSFREARQLLRDALAYHENQDDKLAMAKTLAVLGIVCESQGAYTEAGAFLSHALKNARAVGDEHSEAAGLSALESARAVDARKSEAASLSALGVIQLRAGRYLAALDFFKSALAARDALGDLRGRAATLANIGIARLSMGEYDTALTCFEEALDIQERRHFIQDQARTLADVAGAHQRLGAYRVALEHLERARKICEEIGHQSDLASVLSGLGSVEMLLGDYASAIRRHERAAEIMSALGQRRRYAEELGNQGAIHESIGGTDRALELHEQALRVFVDLRDSTGEAACLRRVGALYGRLGRHERALFELEKALRICRDLGDEAAQVLVLGSIGNAYLAAGQLTAARSRHEHALELAETLGDRAQIAATLGNLGLVCLRLGQAERALELQRKALAAARKLGLRRTVLLNRWGIALAQLALGDAAAAREQVQLAAEEIDASVAGLDDVAGPDAREVWAGLFDVGVLAAVQLGDVEQAFGFMESGRARSLLDALGGRGTLAALTLPPELAEAEAIARAGERRALLAHRRVLRLHKRNRIALRRSIRDLEEARAAVSEVILRAQRDARAAADIVYPEPPVLKDVEACVAEGEVLIEYAIGCGRAVALVVTHEGSRLVELGRASDVRLACEALRPERVESKPGKAMLRLRELVIAPLALPPGTKRLLLSPHDALSYVPFMLLVPGIDVGYVPSAASYVLLHGTKTARGEAVLALGDPAYRSVRSGGHRGGRLSSRPLDRLEATREEANAVGDTVLLGVEASVERFFEELAKRRRWRAVHFACHGIVDASRPFDSALALTPNATSDGYLTALDLLGRRIPADMSVLSGCETGRGRLYRAEGIVGLTRAFMFAGSPRVLCSLWKVDDKATKALMIRFYELWNPKKGVGLPATTALRHAQAFVRAQKGWSHPYYWAAWVLWGLPD